MDIFYICLCSRYFVFNLIVFLNYSNDRSFTFIVTCENNRKKSGK